MFYGKDILNIKTVLFGSNAICRWRWWKPDIGDIWRRLYLT